MGNTQGSVMSHVGFQVLKVQAGSPGAMGGLQPYTDFIVAVNGTILLTDNSVLVDEARRSVNKPMSVTVYNIEEEEMRDLQIMPLNNWGGIGCLGISIRFCSVADALANVWHVLEVYAGSPAATAGLQSQTDFIIGTPDQQIQHPADYEALVCSFDNRPLRFYVYNSDTRTSRLTEIVPNAEWGGSGALGCGIGSGVCHRIPLRPKGSTLAPLDRRPATEMQRKKQAGATATPAPAASSSSAEQPRITAPGAPRPEEHAPDTAPPAPPPAGTGAALETEHAASCGDQDAAPALPSSKAEAVGGETPAEALGGETPAEALGGETPAEALGGADANEGASK